MPGMVRRYIVGSFLALLVAGLYNSAPGAVLPQWSREFSLQGQLAIFYNLLLVGILLGIFVASRVQQRHPWYALQIGLMGAGTLVAALVPGFEGMYAMALLGGFGLGALNLHANAIPMEVVRERPQVLISQLNAAFGLGAVLTPLIAVVVPWRWLFMGIALVMVVTAVVVWRSPATQPVPAPPTGRPGQKRGIALALGIMLLYVGLEVSLATFTGRYLQGLGYSPALVGILLSLYWAAVTVSRLTLGGLLSQRSLHRLFLLSLIPLVTGLLLFFPGWALLYPLAGLALGAVFPVFFSLIQQRYDRWVLEAMFYGTTLGGTLIPAAVSLLPIQTLPIALLGLAGTMSLLIFLKRGLDESTAVRS